MAAPSTRHIEPLIEITPFAGVRVISVAVTQRRLTQRRRQAPWWMEPNQVRTTGAANQSQTWGAFEYSLGPDPPELILPLPTLQMQTITVNCVARRTRVEMSRRAPHYVLQEPVLLFPASLVRRLSTIDVALQAIAQRVASQQRKPHYDLFAPTVLAQPPPSTPLLVFDIGGRTRLESVRRAPHSRLSPPTTLQVFQGPQVTLVAVRRSARPRHTQADLNPPQVVLPLPTQQMQTITTELVAVRRLAKPRHTQANLAPPQVVIPVPSLRVEEITTKLVVTRPRPTHPRYPGPVVVFAAPLAPPPEVVLVAVRGRVDRLRREPFSRLYPPTVVTTTTFVASPIETTLVAVRRAARPRHTQNELTNISYPQTGRVTETLVAVRRAAKPRHTQYELTPPQVVIPVPTLRMQTLTVALVRTRPRHTISRLTYTVYPQTTTIKTTLVAVRDRVDRQRRKPFFRLYAPTVIAPFFAEPISETLVAIRNHVDLLRRRPHYLLNPPQVVIPLPTQQMQTITVELAGRNRIERSRRAPMAVLGAPVVVIPVPLAPPVDVTLTAVRTRTEAVRRAPHSKLYPPSTAPQPAPLAYPTKIKYVATRPRPVHSHLLPPTAVIPVPTQRMQTITVRLALRPRIETQRRVARYLLGKPTVVTQLSLQQQTIDTTLVAVRRLARPRATQHDLTAVSYPQTGEIQVTLVAVRSRLVPVRRTHQFLTNVPPRSQRGTLAVYFLAAIRNRLFPQRAPHSKLTDTVYPQRGTLDTTLVAVNASRRDQKRQTTYFLNPPTVVAPPAGPVESEVQVTLAGRTRLEAQRRAPHYKLYPPHRLFGPPDRIRVGRPGSAWRTGELGADDILGKIGTGWEADDPGEGWENRKPGSGWSVGDPE
jgi:hypothetical protein